MQLWSAGYLDWYPAGFLRGRFDTYRLPKIGKRFMDDMPSSSRWMHRFPQASLAIQLRKSERPLPDNRLLWDLGELENTPDAIFQQLLVSSMIHIGGTAYLLKYRLTKAAELLETSGLNLTYSCVLSANDIIL